MKMYIQILVKESKEKSNSIMIEVLGIEKAWETYTQLKETLYGIAELALIDGETAEIIADTQNSEE
jgi:hypothetical protein